MRFAEIYSSKKPVFSFEFFPPKELTTLPSTLELIRELALLTPDFMTVTYGAGGGTRDLTDKIVRFIHQELMIPVVQHLTCAGHSKAQIDEIVSGLLRQGVTNILSLRGDPPKGSERFEAHPAGFSSARDLTRHLRANFSVSIAVAGYPEGHREAKSREEEFQYLKEKVDAGAEIIITQLFFDPEVYFQFVEQARRYGITVPIVPGVMPISNVSQLERFTGLCGASIPSNIRSALEPLREQPEEVIKFGIDHAVRQCQRLLSGGAPGIHLYTLNRSVQTKPIIQAIRG